MGAISGVLNVLGVVFLSHAVYSAYEHSLLATTSQPSALSPSSLLPKALDPKINLPIDISIETLFAVLLLCIGVVLSSEPLKPISWNVWAGQLERSRAAREIVDVGVGGGNPYAGLEERVGFLDVRRARKELDGWRKDNGQISA